MKQYRLVDNIFGWVAFIIAAFTYCSTIEPTASFWDCPEFITTAYKQGDRSPTWGTILHAFRQFLHTFRQRHYPGSQDGEHDERPAERRLYHVPLLDYHPPGSPTRHQRLERTDYQQADCHRASGMVGALIYTFSDTFWFSAVEGEVYAFSSAFTAVVFWLILKWEDHADEPHIAIVGLCSSPI